MDIEQQIIQTAQEVGFSLCGFAESTLVPEAVERYKSWIAKGYHADMSYLEHIERRTNPRAVMPEAQSIIMLALNYYTAQEEASDQKIARYARGRDYHKVIHGMLKQLTSTLKSLYPEQSFRYYVDYGPFCERTYAVKAGLGFIGKNGMLITKEFGSYVFLAEIITTMKLTPGTPLKQLCGSCTRCLEGCPTSAIVEPEVVDSRKCISYHTIESKADETPASIKEKQSGWAFGCDICQEVCPFNNPRRNHDTPIEDLKPKRKRIELEALESDETFLSTYAGTPLMRAKRKGIIRNTKR